MKKKKRSKKKGKGLAKARGRRVTNRGRTASGVKQSGHWKKGRTEKPVYLPEEPELPVEEAIQTLEDLVVPVEAPAETAKRARRSVIEIVVGAYLLILGALVLWVIFRD